MTKPLDKLTTIIAQLMGKEPSDPDVLEAVVEVVMAMRLPSEAMVLAAQGRCVYPDDEAQKEDADNLREAWLWMIDALLTEGEG